MMKDIRKERERERRGLKLSAPPSTTKTKHRFMNDMSPSVMNPPLPQIPIVKSRHVSLPLAVIQVSPILTLTENDHPVHQLTLSSPIVKLHLDQLCQNEINSLRIIWDDASINTSRMEGPLDNDNDNDIHIHISHATEETRRLGVSGGTLFSIKHDFDKIKSNQVQVQQLQQHQTPQHLGSRLVPYIILPSQDPTNANGIPCLIRGYSIPYCSTQHNANAKRAAVGVTCTSTRSAHHPVSMTNGTLVQILPPVLSQSMNREDQTCTVQIHPSISSRGGHEYEYEYGYEYEYVHLKSLITDISGGTSIHHEYNDANVLLSHEQETVRALIIRMKMIMERQVMVGTTQDAIPVWREGCRRRGRLDRALEHCTQIGTEEQEKKGGSTSTRTNTSTRCSNETMHGFLHDGALTVHDPIHGSGKTTLVATIARTELKCDAVHVIHASALFAQYGASGADAALESLLHGIVMSAAAATKRSTLCGTGIGSVCIILDNLETFVAPGMSGGRNTGDPAIPALNAIGKSWYQYDVPYVYSNMLLVFVHD